MTTKTISAKEAANRARRAMALRDLLLEIEWDVERVSALPQRGWDALARTISQRQVAAGGKTFRSPSPATQAEAIELLRGELHFRSPKSPLPRPVSAAPASAGAPSLRPESGSAGPTRAEGPRIGLNGRPRVPTNVTLMCD